MLKFMYEIAISMFKLRFIVFVIIEDRFSSDKHPFLDQVFASLLLKRTNILFSS